MRRDGATGGVESLQCLLILMFDSGVWQGHWIHENGAVMEDALCY